MNSKQQKRTYSKRLNDKASRSDKMFDLVVGQAESCKLPSAKQAKKITRAKAKKTEEYNSEKLLSVIDEKDGHASDYNDQPLFMIWDDNHQKENVTKQRGKRNARKQPQRRDRNKKDDETKDEEVDDLSEKSGILFVDEVEASATKKEKKKQRGKKVSGQKAVQNVSKKGNDRKHLDAYSQSENDNINLFVQKHLNSSIEIARESAEYPPCALPFVQISPLLLIKDRDAPSPRGDSGNSFEDSSSNEILTPDNQSSSKYTYSYVSTYTYGTSSRFRAGSTNSPCVAMKKFSKLNSTTKPEKENISEMEFPVSLSPIYGSLETTPANKPCSSNSLLTRNQRKKMNTTKEETFLQPRKCSTMLFASEAADVDFGFPVALSAIADTDTCAPADQVESEKDSGVIENSISGEDTEPLSQQDQNQDSDKHNLNGKPNQQYHPVAGNLNTDSKICSFNQSKEKGDSNVHADAVCLDKNMRKVYGAEKTSDVKKSMEEKKASVPIEKVSMEIATKGKNFGILKSLKRKASRCFSSSGSDKRYTQHSDLQPITQSASEEENECVNACPPDSAKANVTRASAHDIDFQDPPMCAVWNEAVNEDLTDLETCCVNRLYMSVHPLMKDKGQLSLTLLNKS